MNRPFLQLLVAARDTYNVSRVRSISGQSEPCFQYLTDLLAHFVSFPSFSLFFLFSSSAFLSFYFSRWKHKMFLVAPSLVTFISSSSAFCIRSVFQFRFSLLMQRERTAGTLIRPTNTPKKSARKLYNDEINLLQL